MSIIYDLWWWYDGEIAGCKKTQLCQQERLTRTVECQSNSISCSDVAYEKRDEDQTGCYSWIQQTELIILESYIVTIGLLKICPWLELMKTNPIPWKFGFHKTSINFIWVFPLDEEIVSQFHDNNENRPEAKLSTMTQFIQNRSHDSLTSDTMR